MDMITCRFILYPLFPIFFAINAHKIFACDIATEKRESMWPSKYSGSWFDDDLQVSWRLSEMTFEFTAWDSQGKPVTIGSTVGYFGEYRSVLRTDKCKYVIKIKRGFSENMIISRDPENREE